MISFFIFSVELEDSLSRVVSFHAKESFDQPYVLKQTPRNRKKSTNSELQVCYSVVTKLYQSPNRQGANWKSYKLRNEMNIGETSMSYLIAQNQWSSTLLFDGCSRFRDTFRCLFTKRLSLSCKYSLCVALNWSKFILILFLCIACRKYQWDVFLFPYPRNPKVKGMAGLQGLPAAGHQKTGPLLLIQR